MFWLPKVLVTVLFPQIPTVAAAKTCFGCQSFFLAAKSGFGSKLEEPHQTAVSAPLLISFFVQK
jgi:hypothetical protein